MARKVQLAGTKFTDDTLPRLQKNDRLEAAGSLLIMDVRDWASGVPANGTLLPNRVEEYASSVLGSALETDLKPKFLIGNNFSGAAGKAERTGKNGFHAITPQSGSAIDFASPTIDFPTKLTHYILQNPQHQYYSSIWARLTRKPLAATHYFYILAAGSQQTNAALHVAGPGIEPANAPTFRPGTTSPGPYLGHRHDPTSTTIGPTFMAEGSKDYYSTNGVPDAGKATPAGPVASSGISWGKGVGGNGIGLSGNTVSGRSLNAGTKDQGASFVFYRMVVEDLTVSGRTWAEVEALDYAMYVQEVLTAGGDFYNDTFTAVSTIP